MKIKKDTAMSAQGSQRLFAPVPAPWFPGRPPIGTAAGQRKGRDTRAMAKLMTGVLDALLPSFVTEKPLRTEQVYLKTGRGHGNQKFRR